MKLKSPVGGSKSLLISELLRLNRIIYFKRLIHSGMKQHRHVAQRRKTVL